MTRSVAVLGASSDRRKFGNKSLRAHLAAGYTVYPVTATAITIEGITAYRSLRDIPGTRIDRVTVYLPPAIGLKLLPEIAAVAPSEVWFNPGADTPEVLAEARRLGLHVIAGCSILDLGRTPSEFED